MTLERLKILVEPKFEVEKAIEALFNPNQIAIATSANWAPQPTKKGDAPIRQFTHGNGATLTVDLFFDTFEVGADVRRNHTDRIAQLLTVENNGELGRPPLCWLMWGKQGVFFEGVLESLNQRFTLFLENGTPVRATLSCTFREWRSNEEDKRRQAAKSANDPKAHTVKRGETLSSIASEHYGDPTAWRTIASANGIDDPRALNPGTVLTIPPLQRSATSPAAPGAVSC